MRRYLNKALELYNATVIVPANYVLFTISAILAAVIFYREMWNMDVVDIFTFLIGCALSFVGVYLLTADAHYYDAARQGQAPEPTPNDVATETDSLLPADTVEHRSSSNEECKKLLSDLLPCWFTDPFVKMVQPPSRVDYELATSNDTVIQTEKESQKRKGSDAKQQKLQDQPNSAFPQNDV